jgi:hypothetical protein
VRSEAVAVNDISKGQITRVKAVDLVTPPCRMWIAEAGTGPITQTAAGIGSNPPAFLTRSASLSQPMVAPRRLQESPFAAQASAAVPPWKFDNATHRTIPMPEPRAPRVGAHLGSAPNRQPSSHFFSYRAHCRSLKHRPGFTDRSSLVLCLAARVRQGDQGRDGTVFGG